MKKFCLTILTIIMLFSFSSCNMFNLGFITGKRRGPTAYNTDYTKKYESTLNAMFDNNWTVKSAEEKYDEGEEACACGYPGINPHTYLVWTIEYRDGDGEPKTFVLNNLMPISDQIESHVKSYISDYYKENFYDLYTKDFPLASSSEVFCSFALFSSNEDKSKANNTREIYSNKLETPEGTLCLSKLTPANVFEMCPVYLSVYVYFSGHPDEKQNFEENAMKQIEAMTESMNKFTSNKLTASIGMGYDKDIRLYTGNIYHFWAFIQGKQVFLDFDELVFETMVFDSYKSMY